MFWVSTSWALRDTPNNELYTVPNHHYTIPKMQNLDALCIVRDLVGRLCLLYQPGIRSLRFAIPQITARKHGINEAGSSLRTQPTPRSPSLGAPTKCMIPTLGPISKTTMHIYICIYVHIAAGRMQAKFILGCSWFLSRCLSYNTTQR